MCRNCNRIAVGLDNGQIKIYKSVDLQCKTVLPYYNEECTPCCFQCTCAEIIAGYEDGNICVRDINSGILKGKITVRNAISQDFPHLMRWQSPKLVVATNSSRIKIWQHVDSSFSLLGKWIATEMVVGHVEFDQDYVILQHAHSPVINVYFPDGRLLRSIRSMGNASGIAYQAGRLITGGEDKILRVWDVGTGACLHRLKGHGDRIVSVHIQNNVILKGDCSGEVIMWDVAWKMETIADDKTRDGFAFAAPHSRTLALKLNDHDLHYFVFGSNLSSLYDLRRCIIFVLSIFHEVLARGLLFILHPTFTNKKLVF